MLFNPLISLIKQVVTTVQKKNEADPTIKTADPAVFEQMAKKLETKGAEIADTDDDLCDVLCEEVNQTQVENEADPNVETADNSVFEEMKKELEALKVKVAEQASGTSVPDAPAAPNAGSSANSEVGVMAMINSGGGSLSLRIDPNMGSVSFEVRIEDSTLVKVIEYSDNKIMLDGKLSRFVRVEAGGQTGWLLESYLNFN